MASDHRAAAAETPCLECGSLQAERRVAETLEYECRDCGAAFETPRGGVGTTPRRRGQQYRSPTPLLSFSFLLRVVNLGL